jgi:hypothetical protein
MRRLLLERRSRAKELRLFAPARAISPCLESPGYGCCSGAPIAEASHLIG